MEEHEVKHYPTDVKGLDMLLRNGLVLPHSGQGLITLIKGRPGTGKTTLALQMADGAFAWNLGNPGECPVRFYTAEQRSQDIKTKLEQMRRSRVVESRKGSQRKKRELLIRSLLHADKTANREQPFTQAPPVLEWIHGLVSELAQESGPQPPRIRALVLDGLNLLESKEQPLLELHRLVAALRQYCRVGIIVYDSPEGAYANVDFMADMIIELRGVMTDLPGHYYLNKLSIVKSRFQSSALGWHQYKIGGDGIVVFPSIHFRVSRPGLMADRRTSARTPIPKLAQEDKELRVKQNSSDKKEKAKEFDDIITQILRKKNLKRGSCTVILGPRRTAKTLLTLDFLRAASRQDEGSLLVSLLDNQGTIIEQPRCLCEKTKHSRKLRPCSTRRCYKKVYLLHFRPGCIAPDEFFDVLEERLLFGFENKEHEVRRLAFWDLTQLEDRFPLLAEEPLFLPLLMDHLKNSPYPGAEGEARKITSLFMGAPNTELGKAASAMADNVLFCWRDYLSKDETKGGVAIYTDRIEGQPQVRQLHLLHEDPELELEELKSVRLVYAEPMIDRIQEMQGLPRDRTELTELPPRLSTVAGDDNKPGDD